MPYVTQAPLKPGERRLYDFPLVQAGTCWMHSHFGLQEQPMMTAPLILRDGEGPEEQAGGPRRPDRDMQGAGSGMKMSMASRDLNDVKYDAFLANRCPLSDPEVVRVLPGRRVRLRLINAASATTAPAGRPGLLDGACGQAGPT